MRKIKYITLHHSAVSQPDINKVIISFNRTHKARLHKKKNGLGYYIAYHYIIGEKGEIVHTRPLNSIGYINTNYNSNKESVGICLVGNFDKTKPNSKQLASLDKLIIDLKNKLGQDVKVNGHRDVYPKKTCPGKMFPLKEIKLLYNNTNIMSYFRKIWEAEVPKEERIFKNYNDKRPISVEDTKFLLDIAIYRDNKKDRGLLYKLLFKIKEMLKKK